MLGHLGEALAHDHPEHKRCEVEDLVGNAGFEPATPTLSR